MKMTKNSYVCKVCKAITKHNERYDAYYCQHCDEWNEVKCSDPDCYFCPERPAKPSQAKGKEYGDTD